MSYEYERAQAPAGALRLHLNENTAGCSPRVIAALQRLTRTDVSIYPDYDDAIRATAARLDVSPDEVLLTNGLDDGILATAVTALRHSPADAPFEAIVVVPAFDMYAVCSNAAGGRVVEVPLGANFAFPTDDVIAAITPRTRVIFLANPNNPTGQGIPRDEMLAIAKEAPQAVVFVDECYADFSGETLIGDAGAAAHANIVIGRTFAKAYGLAGIRAGALVASPERLTPLRRTVPPYTLNVAASVALAAAFDDVGYFEWYLAQARESKALLYTTLDRLAVKDRPSAANFVLAHFGADLARVVAGLGARGALIRDRSTDAGCAGCARITAGVVEHTELCAAALEEVLCGAA